MLRMMAMAAAVSVAVERKMPSCSMKGRIWKPQPDSSSIPIAGCPGAM
ncbi:MAG: hypothetical protein WCO90_12135 [Planctomycetota bacterium]